jgi:hypothetical protein
VLGKEILKYEKKYVCLTLTKKRKGKRRVNNRNEQSWKKRIVCSKRKFCVKKSVPEKQRKRFSVAACKVKHLRQAC